MKKIRLLVLILGILLLVSDNLSFIFRNYNHPNNDMFICVMIFMNVGLIANIIFLLVTTKKDRDAFMYGYSLYLISSGYVSVESIVAHVFMYANTDIKIAYYVQGTILVTYLIYVVMVLIGIIYHRQERDYVDKKVNYIKEINSMNSLILNIIDDSNFKQKFESFVEKVTYSDPMSPDSALELEQKIVNYLNVLKTKVENKDYVEANNLLVNVTNLLDERSKICLMK
ncbi:MAG: hypothetical protein IJS83_02985 [Acholeplasmatales bacterium]|nr:hypothetical protein [Acholeplasmatales bacterium]